MTQQFSFGYFNHLFNYFNPKSISNSECEISIPTHQFLTHFVTKYQLDL